MACGWGLLGRFPRSICGIHQRGLCPHSGLWHLPGRMREAQRRLPRRRGRWAGGLGGQPGEGDAQQGLIQLPLPKPPHLEASLQRCLLRQRWGAQTQPSSHWGGIKEEKEGGRQNCPRMGVSEAPQTHVWCWLPAMARSSNRWPVGYSCQDPCLCWGRLSAAGF